MNIATSPTREQFPLSFNKIIKKTVIGLILFTVILFFLYIFFAVATFNLDSSLFLLGTMGFLIFFFVVGLVVYLYQRWYFATYFYDLNSDYIVIRKGPITPREITIPYERVQDVYVDQDIFDRMFGLYDVHLSSATASSGMEAHIDGVEKVAADGLRALLLQTVSQRISRTKQGV